MREIVVISGKGGTGKTSITASLAMLAGNDAVVCDCDVDAADMHILLQPDFSFSEEFFGGYVARIKADKCIMCNRCKFVCRFDAINIKSGALNVDTINCEGCGYCEKICEYGAIDLIPHKSGMLYHSKIKSSATMIHARLNPGADNSGKLVAKVKSDARKTAKEQSIDLIIVDGPPGVGCPVISSIADSDMIILVTEPTVSGLHDIKRVNELIKKFKIKTCCIINKADINHNMKEKIRDYLIIEGIELISELPYNEDFTKAMTKAQTIIEYDNELLKNKINKIWNFIKGDENENRIHN